MILVFCIVNSHDILLTFFLLLELASSSRKGGNAHLSRERASKIGELVKITMSGSIFCFLSFFLSFFSYFLPFDDFVPSVPYSHFTFSSLSPHVLSILLYFLLYFFQYHLLSYLFIFPLPYPHHLSAS